MAVEKNDPSFHERFLAPLVAIFLGAPFLGIVIMGGLFPQHKQLALILTGMVIVAMITALAVLYRQVLGHYRCPQCQKELPRYKDAPRRAEHLFYCKDCDVIWKTGLQEGE